MTTNPRSIATAARGTVIIGSGLALGVLSAHFYGQAAISASDSQPQAAAKTAKPKVVTIKRTKHVKSDPIIVYRQVPAGGSSGSTYVPPSSSGSSSSGGGGNVAPAPAAPKPAPAAPAAANSGAS